MCVWREVQRGCNEPRELLLLKEETEGRIEEERELKGAEATLKGRALSRFQNLKGQSREWEKDARPGQARPGELPERGWAAQGRGAPFPGKIQQPIEHSDLE